MRHYAVIGDPVEHSLSPEIYNELFLRHRVEADFIRLRIKEEELCDIRSITKELSGFAVTMPHKRSIIPYLDRLEVTAARCGAVNIVKRELGELVGCNTDGAGLVNAVHAMGFDPAGKRAAILGRGGAALSAAFALSDCGAEVTLLVRSLSLGSPFAESIFAYHSEPCDIFINASPLGMQNNKSFDDFAFLERLSPKLVFDMVYKREGETALTEAASALGIKASSGYPMLYHQALLAFDIWQGQA